MDLELQIKEEPGWLEETGNTLLVTAGKMAGDGYVTDPEQLRAYVEAITQGVAAKVKHADPALPALMVYHREGKDRVEETCTVFNYLGNFTKHGAQDPVELTEAVLPWAFIIRPENQSWFRCYERNLSRVFQVIRLPGMGTRPQDDKQEAATQTLQEAKTMSTTATQTAMSQSHKQIGTDSCSPSVLEPMTVRTDMDSSTEMEMDASWSSETATQGSPPDNASFIMQTSGCALQDSENTQVPASTDDTDQKGDASSVAGHPLPLQSPGCREGHYQDETCADVKKEVVVEVPAIDELVPYIKEEDNVENIPTLTADPLYSSDVRSKLFSQRSNLDGNLLTDVEDKSYCCSVCTTTFALKGSLKAHMLTHSGQRPHCCSACSRIYPTNSKLKIHMLTHSGERPYHCSLCNAAFPVKGSLKRHLSTHAAVRPYSCSLCNKIFSQKGNLKGHMLTHTGAKPISCSLCTSRFAFKSQLKSHMLTHCAVGRYFCSICNKMFSQKGNLNAHVLTHTGAKPISCSLCSSRFSFKCHLKNHMLIHSGIRLHSCKICNKKFTERAQLNKHMFTHSGNRPYLCNECDSRFSRKSTLVSHMATHSEEKPYFCSVCNSNFARESNLKNHLLLHSREGRYICNVCNSTFSKKSSLKVHLLEHTRESVC